MIAPLRSLPDTRTEDDIEAGVIRLYTLAGGVVYRFSQGYRKERGGTRQTPGISDLEVWWPAHGVLSKHETKTPAGLKDHYRLLRIPRAKVAKSALDDWRRAHAQAKYRDLCHQCGTPYAIGGMAAANEVIRQVTGKRFTLLVDSPLPRTRHA